MIRTTDVDIIQKTEREKKVRISKEHQNFRNAVTQANIEYRLQTAKFQRKWVNTAKPTKIRVHQVLSNGIWSGYRCFIIGGGTSLQDFDFDLLRGEKIIAVNRAFEVAPFADFMFSMDSRYYQWIIKGQMGDDIKRKFHEFKGIKIFVDTVDFPYKEVITVKAIDRVGLSWDLKQGIYHGNNSGYSALQFALTLRASPIYLLGFDFYHQGIKSHWHKGYPHLITEKITQSHLTDFKYIAQDLTVLKNKIKIINLNPKSSLRCFPRMRREEIEYHGSDRHH